MPMNFFVGSEDLFAGQVPAAAICTATCARCRRVFRADSFEEAEELVGKPHDCEAQRKFRELARATFMSVPW